MKPKKRVEVILHALISMSGNIKIALNCLEIQIYSISILVQTRLYFVASVNACFQSDVRKSDNF
jgi:hypothetical protein